MVTTIAVLGDVHVTTGGAVPAAFTGVVTRHRVRTLLGEA